jgi:hypothetical protein
LVGLGVIRVVRHEVNVLITGPRQQAWAFLGQVDQILMEPVLGQIGQMCATWTCLGMKSVSFCRLTRLDAARPASVNVMILVRITVFRGAQQQFLGFL